jgi:hypothetical protein
LAVPDDAGVVFVYACMEVVCFVYAVLGEVELQLKQLDDRAVSAATLSLVT